MRTVVSGLRYVLRRLDVIDPADGPLDPAWTAQLAPLEELKRAGLIAFARFCSRRAWRRQTCPSGRSAPSRRISWRGR
jgi:hypothetical protein